MTARGQFPDEQQAGAFKRQEDAFRDWVSSEPSARYPVESGRYHLYVSLACPWATRVAMARTLLGLEHVIGLTVLDPWRDEKGWAFRDGPGFTRDPVNGFAFLSEAYAASDPAYRGRWTVPALWDKKGRRIVNNSEDDLCRMFNDVFRPLVRTQVNLFPTDLEPEQAQVSEWIYRTVNNGVYRAGFATDQAVYEDACRELFDSLDALDARLTSQRYLFGSRIVESDWRLFNTLIRFDAVYYGHFKCNLRRIVDYPALRGYMKDLYQQPGISELVNIAHIKTHYYATHLEINPNAIVPLGPVLDLAGPHGRERL